MPLPLSSPSKAPENVLPDPLTGSPVQKKVDMLRANVIALAEADAEDWSAMLALCDTPMTDFSAEDQTTAQRILLSARIWAITQGDTVPSYRLSEPDRVTIRESFIRVAAITPDYYTTSCFRPYLDSVGYLIPDRYQAYCYLRTACKFEGRMAWLRKLRVQGLALFGAASAADDDEDVSAEVKNILVTLPDVMGELTSAFLEVQQSFSLTDVERIECAASLLDLKIRQAAPWDAHDIAQEILALPCPTARQLAAFPVSPAPQAVSNSLTPQCWAFLWELGHAQANNHAAIRRCYPLELGGPFCDGMRLVLESLYAPKEQALMLLGQGADLLCECREAIEDFFGSGLLVAGPNGLVEIDYWDTALFLPLLGEELLLDLLENHEEDYPAQGELLALYRLFDLARHGPRDADKDKGDTPIAKVANLYPYSISLQYLMAHHHEKYIDRITVLLDAICRSVTEGRDPEKNFYLRSELKDGVFAPEDVPVVLAEMEKLWCVQDAMSPAVRKVWEGLLVDIFAVLKLQPPAGIDQVLVHARRHEEELRQAGFDFSLGYFEQKGGDLSAALAHYLACAQKEGAPVHEALSQNIRSLLNSEERPESLAGMESALAAAATTKLVALVQPLLALARQRQQASHQENQLHKTAVNRWPSLSQPARKLLGALQSIQTFSSFEELGSYAGMEAKWAKIHYHKLLSDAMLLEDRKGSYRINPYIQPLLAQESLHAVVGRIVRTQGTSAVKQVFNSQREFSIYQVLLQLCPNQLVFPNSSLQSIMAYDQMKELVSADDFGYYLRASVDIVIVSTTTYLPMVAIEIDSIYHDTDRQKTNDDKKDRLFAAGGVPFMRLRPMGSPSESTIRGQVAAHLDDMVRAMRTDLPGYAQAKSLLQDLGHSGPLPVLQ